MKISISRHNHDGCLPLLVTLGAMVWIAAVHVQIVNAQVRSDMVWMPNGHGNLADATKQDQPMKGFVAKHSKGLKKQLSGDASVHVVYLVPSDKRPRHIYTPP